jgi:hypothetical protein
MCMRYRGMIILVGDYFLTLLITIEHNPYNSVDVSCNIVFNRKM